MRVNWKRGAIRIWIVVSVLWCAAVGYVALEGAAVSSLPPIHTTVHVKISNTETWDYSSEMGVEAIRADLTKRLKEKDAEDRAWAEKLPESRKVECRAIPPHTPFTAQPPDCVKLFFVYDDSAVPSGWENQIVSQPSPIWEKLVKTVPLAIGPPLLLLVLGLISAWVIIGFRSSD